VFYAFCEAPALFAIITFMLTGVYWVLIPVMILLFIMISKFPTKQSIINNLQLNWQEQLEL
jgi:hypothetical protein